MPFIVRKGVPGILELWKRLLKAYEQDKLDAEERELFKVGKGDRTPAR